MREYGLSRWKKLRRAQIAKEPLCRRCEAKGKIVPATIADHVVPHRGDVAQFWSGALQSLCKRCHDGEKQSEEKLGYSRQIGLDGFPIDDQHPIHRNARLMEARRAARPKGPPARIRERHPGPPIKKASP